ncbi:Ribonuclease H-like domain [Ceratocystis lukuohia]|uniref:Ribonuclease H-like domain n=1 Tax=Ceratocystis lukuohia TaxID=2019550 RepID=A0ABR4MAA5_9PEZI
MSDESNQGSPDTRSAIISQLSETSDGRATTRMGSSLTRDERIKAIQEIIDILDSHKVMDDCACDMLFDVFGEWTADEWRDLGGMYSRLRSELIRHGVYVPHHRITGSMMNSIEVASHPVDEWTDEMMKQYDTISLVYTGQSALQERLTKEKIPRDLWTVRQWILEDKTQGARPTQERAVRVAQPKQGNVTKGTQDVREEYRQESATMADKVERDATNRVRKDADAFLEQKINLGALQEKTEVRDFAHLEYRTPSLHSNAYETEQRKILILLEKTWPKEEQFSGAMDSVSLWHRFRVFLHQCRQYGLDEHYLHYALPSMMAVGPARDLCRELVITTDATDWKSVMIQMERRFENAGMKLARDNRWLQYSLDEFIRDKGDGRPLHEIVFAFYEWLERGQLSLSPTYQGHDALRDRLLANLRQHHATAKESSRYGYSNMTALDIAIHVCDALRADLQAANVERRGQQLVLRGSAFANRPMSVEDVDAHVEQLLVDRRFSKPKLYGRRALRKCFICQKEGHFMNRHTKAERDRHMAEWRTKKPSGPAHVYAMDAFDMEYGSFHGCAEEEEEFGPDQTTETYVTWVDGNGRETLDALDDNKVHHWLVGASAPRGMSHAQREPAAKDGSRYSSDEFMGLIIDTGAAKVSTAGISQFKALQALKPELALDTATKGHIKVRFGMGQASSLGTTVIDTGVGSVTFHVMDADTPFLLSLADLDRLGAFFNNTKNKLVKGAVHVNVFRRFGHAFLHLPEMPQGNGRDDGREGDSFFTEQELRRLHRRFGHPSVSKLHALLRKAELGDTTTHEDLKKIQDFCHQCQTHEGPPKRFRFKIHGDDPAFNSVIYVDVGYMDTGISEDGESHRRMPFLHVVDEATGFSAARWLSSMTAKHCWDMLRECWIDTYQGPPDVIVHDQGTSFTGAEFSDQARLLGTVTKGVATEAHHRVGKVERAHAMLKRAFSVMTKENSGVDRALNLQMAVKAVNDTSGPEGLVPTMLVFGAYPRLTSASTPSPSMTKRARAIKMAMAELERFKSNRQVTEALATRNGPDPEIPAIGAQVLTWRENAGNGVPGWCGPFTVVSTDASTVVVDNGNGMTTTMARSSVKPYNLDTEVETAPQPPRRGRGRPRRAAAAYAAITTATGGEIWIAGTPEEEDNGTFPSSSASAPAPDFIHSRQTEVNGLLEKGVFEIVTRESVPPRTRLFKARFVDEVKHAGTAQAIEKSRLVVSGHSDADKSTVLTQAPTIQRMSQRALISVGACRLEGGKVRFLMRDISQAYVQSLSKLARAFYLDPKKEVRDILGIGVEKVLRVLKPLYGIAEAGNHWFATYSKHHIEKLKMRPSTYDSCLMMSTVDGECGMVGLQTDDTLILSDDNFAQREAAALKEAGFLAKNREELSKSHGLKFNGGLLSMMDDGSLYLSQERQVMNIDTIDNTPKVNRGSRGKISEPLTCREQYVAQRARGAYVASVCQPEASFDMSTAAQHTNPDEEQVKALNLRLQWQKDNAGRGLRYVKLDEDTMRIMCFTDAAFANNNDFTSQIGYVIALADEEGKANIVHWSSTKCKRVTRSVLAAELYALVHGFDVAACLKATYDEIYKRKVPLVLCTDSKSIFDAITRLGTTTEKRLMIDIQLMRQAYERREVAELKWIAGGENPADQMTKVQAKACDALTRLIDTNRISVTEQMSVERPPEGGA